ncbi:MAG TPA: flagellar hook capping FlgD N-terminal domain-containing protein [Bryobacteraceae bacterium]|nr:flagellar hook capping FlgD N-terminal domain-containing protein [Bryobacteraceae bacterium]
MTPTVSSSASAASGAESPPKSVANPTVSKNMFLQLLVAQIKNQDPLNPADGVQFLTQLAQFTQLEQSMTMSTDLAAIRQDLDQLVPKTQTEKQS